MIYRIIIIAAGLWAVIYSASYGFFEYKNKNPCGAAGVWVLASLTLVALAGVII